MILLKMTPIAWAVVAAVGNVAGAFIVTRNTKWSKVALDTMIAFAAGFMMSVAFVDMAPEAIRTGGPSAGFIILLGFMLIHLTQHSIAPHFHFGEETHDVTRSVGVSALLGLLLHAFIDGVAVASGFNAGIEIGSLVLMAVILHKLPEGSAISSLFLAAGFSRGRALLAGVALGLATILGAIFTDKLGLFGPYGLAISAGVTIYVAACNLIPEFQNKRNWRIQGAFFVGGIISYISHLLVHSNHGHH